MNRDEIIRLAIECQLVTTGNRDGFYMDALAKFAALVAAAEREECARVCDEVIEDLYMDSDAFEEVLRCVKAIRARGEA